MPLWSNEEWRARIGSSWCALGQPFKTDKSSGSYRSYAQSGRVMLIQAVYVLMTLILVQGLGVKNKCQKQVKSNFHLRGVLMILILLLQTKAFVQLSLLLRCGDIESNPGPYLDLDYDDVDGSTVLTEDDFREVYREVVNIQSSYYQFGIELGLPLREMDAIKKAFQLDIPQAFTEVLRIWLRHRYNVEKYGPPTWRRLVEAVDSPTGGCNHVLAKTIAEHHSSVVVDCPEGIEALIQRCHATMAAYYLKQFDDRAWPPAVKSATDFINLALIKDQTSWRRTVQKSVDDIVKNKTKTSYKSMVSNSCVGKFTLLEGRPGSGKTVLLNMISCDWANGKILKPHLLIFLPLRRLREEPDRKLATLLKVACPALRLSQSMNINKLVSHIQHTQGEGVVFAFDGFDEYVPCHYRKKVAMTSTIEEPSSDVSKCTPIRKRRWHHIFTWKKRSQHNTIESPKMAQTSNTEVEYVEDIFEILNGKNLTKSTIFVTSRPAACNDIREGAGKRIEVLGFLKPQIRKYFFDHYFGTDKLKAKQSVAHLLCCPNLMNMAYLPLHCAMLAFLYKDDDTCISFPPESLTETKFYKHFTLSTLLRSSRRKYGNIPTINSFDQIPQPEKIVFHNVCKLAFNATVNSKQVFTSADIRSILPDTDSTHARKDVSDLGLIVTDHYYTIYGGPDDTYTFLHLTFQEYLAAVYIAGLSESEQADIIHKNKDKKNLFVVWKFLCGTMMDFSCTNVMDTFKSLIEATTEILVNIQCCYETQHSSPCNYVINTFNGRLVFNSYNFTPSDCAAIGYTIKKSDFRPMVFLTFRRCSFSSEGALCFLHSVGDHPLSLTMETKYSCASNFLDSFSQCPVPGLCNLNLNLSGNNMGDAGIQALVEGLKQCNSTVVKELNLSDNSIDDTGAQSLAEGLKHCTNMNKVNLMNNVIGDTGICAVAEGLKCCTYMEELNLSHNCFGDTGTQALAESLKHCTYIKKLDFHDNKIHNNGIQALAENLKYCANNMEELNFSHNGISDIGAQALAKSLKHSVNMKGLNLERNYITTTGAQPLMKSLKYCINLQELNFGCNNLSDDDVPHLIKAIKTFKNLERLVLEHNDFTASGVDRICSAVIERNTSTTMVELSVGTIVYYE